MFFAAREAKFLHHGVVYQIGAAGHRRQKSSTPRHAVKLGPVVARLSERVADQSRAKLRLSQRRTPSKLLQLFIPVPQRTHTLRAVSCKNPKLRRCRSWINHQNSAVLTQHNKSPRTSTSLPRRLIC